MPVIGEMRPIERRVRRLAEAGVDPTEIAWRFRKSPRFIKQVLDCSNRPRSVQVEPRLHPTRRGAGPRAGYRRQVGSAPEPRRSVEVIRSSSSATRCLHSWGLTHQTSSTSPRTRGCLVEKFGRRRLLSRRLRRARPRRAHPVAGAVERL
jgi:hypothetical protein